MGKVVFEKDKYKLLMLLFFISLIFLETILEIQNVSKLLKIYIYIYF